MADYDREAMRYDTTRGGDARADAAAAAICSALGEPDDRDVVDVACGTGIVTVRIARYGYSVLGIDRSPGMLSVAAQRLPGRVAVGDATRLPLASGSASAVTMVWLLQLLGEDGSQRALAEAARVVRPGGLLVTTVDKNDAPYHDRDEAAVLARQVRAGSVGPSADAAHRVLGIGRSLDFTHVTDTTFTGRGQGLSPRGWLRRLQGGRGNVRWARTTSPDRLRDLFSELARLPGQDRVRPDPVYRLVVLRKAVSARVRGTPRGPVVVRHR